MIKIYITVENNNKQIILEKTLGFEDVDQIFKSSQIGELLAEEIDDALLKNEQVKIEMRYENNQH